MIKIAILDSGVLTSHTEFKKNVVKGIRLYIDSNGEVKEDDNFEDKLGHGTALYYLISKNVKNVEIYNIKIYDESSNMNQFDFERYLEYIYNNYYFDIINISMGITRVKSIKKLQKICELFYNKKTILVSAFDNYGAISFPAALNYVIGVDSLQVTDGLNQPIVLKNNLINVVSKSSYKKVPWVDPKYNIIKGTSFTCAEITTLIAKIIMDNGKSEVIKHFNLDQNINFYDYANNHMEFNIKKAVVFPFNKECHSIANYEKHLDFEIVDYFSLKITGQVGKKISQITSCKENNKIIKDINNILWDKFDTLILGHTDYLERLSHRLGIKESLIDIALKKGKQVFMFDIMNEYIGNKNVYMPYLDNSMCIPRNGKLFQTNIPVICVCGTNSKQGKYTLQLYIRKKLLEAGYNVGEIGTEPNALLFGMNEVFHCGYNKLFNLDDTNITLMINQQIWNIANNGADVILGGTQSGILPYNNRNIVNSTLRHQIVFQAIQPDAIIICINPYDSIEFIKRTICAVEGLSNGKVVGLVCFPVDYAEKWGKSFMKVQRVTQEKEEFIKQNIMRNLNLNVYMLDKEHELNTLINNCIDFLSS